VQDPEPYLRNLDIEVPCVVFPDRQARIDSSMRRRIGHDFFYFSSAQAMKLFDRDPMKYVKVLSDPITSARFSVKRTSLHAAYRGRTYYFMADSTKTRFLADPKHWKERRGQSAVEAGEVTGP
jgi:YHS domain-containing protein